MIRGRAITSNFWATLYKNLIYSILKSKLNSVNLVVRTKILFILLSVVFVREKRGVSVRILGKPVQKLELDLTGTEVVLKLMRLGPILNPLYHSTVLTLTLIDLA